MATGIGDSLRVSDLTHFKRMVGSHSTVLRIGVDGVATPAGGWPLQVGMPIHEVLNGSEADLFRAACESAAETCRTTIFETADANGPKEVTITPVLDDHSSSCRYLVCWIRQPRTAGEPTFGDLRPDEVDLHWRRRSVGGRLVVEAAPLWSIPGHAPYELWEHVDELTALGLGPVVVGRVLHQACSDFAHAGGAGLGLYLSLPAGDMMHDVVATVMGAARSSGLPPERLTLSVPVAVAVEDHHRSTLMHLQAIGLRLEVQGSGQLAKSLFGLDDRYEADEVLTAAHSELLGPWAPTIADALIKISS